MTMAEPSNRLKEMRFFRNIFIHLAAAALAALPSCGLAEDDPGAQGDGSRLPLSLRGEISQVYLTRANDSGFADGDEIGVYVVDYENGGAGTLGRSGNRADNVRFTYDEAGGRWNPATQVYWKDKTTHVDIYGYYPYSSSVDKVNEYAFEVLKDQSSAARDGGLGGYEASDFLWGKAEDIAPTDKAVNVPFTHRLSCVRVTLVEGTGFSSGEWSAADKSVVILGTKRQATVDLATGTASPEGEVDPGGIVPCPAGGDFRAIVVPQELSAGTVLLSVTVGGYSYKYSRSEATVYSASRQHNFTITVNKKEQGDFEFVPSGESITAWENDTVSHDGTAREYIVINVDTPGTLDWCIENAGKDAAKIKNLKLTGSINNRDFAVMRYRMTALQSLNLKEVRLKAGVKGHLDDEDERYFVSGDDEIPTSALWGRESLYYLVLPDNLKAILGSPFGGCSHLKGTLTIPSGVKSIGVAAFQMCGNLTGDLVLPDSLKFIDSDAFEGCGFNGKLILPDSVEEIGSSAFAGCDFTGELHLPKNLKKLWDTAFSGTGFSGGITIPSGVTAIRRQVFMHCGKLNGTLTLPGGITSIEDNAFYGCGFRGELVLPKELTVIEPSAFSGCDFSGTLVLPEKLELIGAYAFAGNYRLSGILTIPDNIQSIEENCFNGCSGLEGLVLPENLDVIGSGAFQGCYGLNSIVCEGTIPPQVCSGAFDGVPKDAFTVEVPQASVVSYQTAPGWKDFKRISAYRNFVVRPSAVSAINTKTTRDLVLNADGEWMVESKPDWVSLSQVVGEGKTGLTLEFSQMPPGADREGEVVFKLKDKDFRTVCKVSQYDCDYAEDEIVTLRKAEKGNGVNIVFLGDGFSAKEVSDGLLMSAVNEAAGYLFAIEPFKTYAGYFNVYTGIAVSQESGVGGINTVVNNRFNTTSKGDGTLGGRNGDSDYNEIFKYACKAPTVSESDLGKTLIVVVPNTADYGGICYMYSGGEAIAYCPMSDDDYPYDFRGILQHEAGGHGFGKLGDEYVSINSFVDREAEKEIKDAKSLGWYDNLSLTGKMSEVPWSHLIFHEKYSSVVDIYEGGYKFSRGVYRSESTSCMNNNIPYYNAISRESIVRRIKALAGEEFSFEDFVANDGAAGVSETSATRGPLPLAEEGRRSHKPVRMGVRPPLK